MERGEMAGDTKRNNETHWQEGQESNWPTKSITNEAMCFGRWVYLFPRAVMGTTLSGSKQKRPEVSNQGGYGHTFA